MLRLRVENSDDLWVLYTLLREGDQVTMRTLREIKQGEGGRSRRVPMILTIVMKHMEFQPFTNKLRIRGSVIEGPDVFGLLGSHHTLSVDVGDELIVFREDGWSGRDLQRLEKLSMKLGSILIVAIDYDEVGISIYRRQGVKGVLNRDLKLSGKGSESRDVELRDALREIARDIELILKKESDIVGIIVAGPGFLKEQLASELSELVRNMPIAVESASMGGEAGVREAIARGKPAELLRSQEMQEIDRILDRALELLGEKPGYIAIGLEECERASLMGAVDLSLVLDELLSVQRKEMREKVEAILERIYSYGGKIHVVPSSSPAGERVFSLGGIICLLRFPVKEERGNN
ncbi:MAG: hypothetical protein QW039_05130 [Fervidicoccaceae archaeon]